MWIVVEGSIIEGLKFYGPFDTNEAATNYGDHLEGFNFCVKLIDQVEFPINKVDAEAGTLWGCK